MQALVLNDDRDAQVAMSVALLKRNFQVVTADTVAHAMAYADTGVIDLVVMGERVQGRLSHEVALAAELRNPDVTTMMLTPRTDGDVDELYELLPSLYCLLGEALAPEIVARMAVCGVAGRAGAVAPRQAADGLVDGGDGATQVADGLLADIMARASNSLAGAEPGPSAPGRRETAAGAAEAAAA